MNSDKLEWKTTFHRYHLPYSVIYEIKAVVVHTFDFLPGGIILIANIQ